MTSIIYAYLGQPPELVPVNLTDSIVVEVVRRLSGGTGPGGTDSISLHHWLLSFGKDDGKLLQIVAEFAEWLKKERPPWAAYRTLVYGRLISLDKHPVVQPEGFGKNWQIMISKCVLEVAGQEAKEA